MLDYFFIDPSYELSNFTNYLIELSVRVSNILTMTIILIILVGFVRVLIRDFYFNKTTCYIALKNNDVAGYIINGGNTEEVKEQITQKFGNN